MQSPRIIGRSVDTIGPELFTTSIDDAAMYQSRRSTSDAVAAYMASDDVRAALVRDDLWRAECVVNATGLALALLAIVLVLIVRKHVGRAIAMRAIDRRFPMNAKRGA